MILKVIKDNKITMVECKTQASYKMTLNRYIKLGFEEYIEGEIKLDYSTLILTKNGKISTFQCRDEEHYNSLLVSLTNKGYELTTKKEEDKKINYNYPKF